MKKIYYFDEAGYTGADLTNAEQPYFFLASVRFTNDEIERIKTDLCIDETNEIHFKRLYKSADGRKKIMSILTHALVDKQHVKIGFAMKRYCIYVQIVDVLIETMAFNLDANLYANRNNLILANLLYSFSTNHSDQTLIAEFEKSFVNMVRAQDPAAIREFYKITDSLRNSKETSKAFRRLLDMVFATHAIVNEAFTIDSFYLDNTLSIFISLVYEWYKQDDNLLTIKFDDSKPIAKREALLKKLMTKSDKSLTIGPEGYAHTYPLPIESLEMVNSRNHFGIQIADLIASAAYFLLTNTNFKYANFRANLGSIPILQTADITLQQATPDFLRQAMNSPYNEAPIDALADFMKDCGTND